MATISQSLVLLRQSVTEGMLTRTESIVTALQALQQALETSAPDKGELLEIRAALRDAEPFLEQTGRFLSSWQSTIYGPTYSPGDGQHSFHGDLY